MGDILQERVRKAVGPWRRLVACSLWTNLGRKVFGIIHCKSRPPEQFYCISNVFCGKVHSQVAWRQGSLAHDFLASRFPWNKAKSHGCSMSCARWNCFKPFVYPAQRILTGTLTLDHHLLWFRPAMLVVTQDEISLSKYCMMFSLQPSNAQQLPPLSEIMK